MARKIEKGGIFRNVHVTLRILRHLPHLNKFLQPVEELGLVCSELGHKVVGVVAGVSRLDLWAPCEAGEVVIDHRAGVVCKRSKCCPKVLDGAKLQLLIFLCKYQRR